MSPSEILSKAADLIEPEGKWTQNVYGLNADGKRADRWYGGKGDAVCWCAIGAIEFVGDISPQSSNAKVFLTRAIGEDFITDWNDAPERTQAEVVAALRKAASLAQEKESV